MEMNNNKIIIGGKRKRMSTEGKVPVKDYYRKEK